MNFKILVEIFKKIVFYVLYLCVFFLFLCEINKMNLKLCLEILIYLMVLFFV